MSEEEPEAPDPGEPEPEDTEPEDVVVTDDPNIYPDPDTGPPIGGAPGLWHDPEAKARQMAEQAGVPPPITS